MKKPNFVPEKGSIEINGHKMEYVLRRSKSESAFGIRGSRIFELEMKKDGNITGKYAQGWTKQISDEDEETALFLSYLVDKFGKSRPKKKKEMGCLD